MNEFTVGQVLYYVPDSSVRGGTPHFVTILKVGRKWLSCRRMRVDKDSLNVDGNGYASPGKCWLSKEEYEQYSALNKAWADFRRKVDEQRQPSKGLSVDDIQGVIQLLFYGEKVKELSE